MGAPWYDAGQSDEGAAFVFLGSAAGIADGSPATAATQLESNQQPPPNNTPYFGGAVAGAGDVNGDGYDDVIVGAPYYQVGQAGEGAAFIFLGSATGIADSSAPTAATQLQSNDRWSGLGGSVAGADDVDGDGYDDVIVGAPAYQNNPLSWGAAFLFLGSSTGVASGTPTTSATQLFSNQGNVRLGGSVAGAGDVNGDGHDDVIVGAPWYGGDDGEAFVFLGGTCANGADDDGDGLTDYPADPGCGTPADLSERATAACDDGIDNDGDGETDYPSDANCVSPEDASESPEACDDGLDNDGDGLVDFPADPGCQTPNSSPENPQCQDGIDNDGQPGIDFDGGASVNDGVPITAPDPQCTAAWKRQEAAAVSCGLGLELALALPAAVWLRARRARHRGGRIGKGVGGSATDGDAERC